MLKRELLDKVNARVRVHCKGAKGYEEGPWVNPLVPVDCVSAFMMARLLTGHEAFDDYVAVAPEGHVYGYFFEQLGHRVLSVHVDYPPRRCEVLDDLSGLCDSSVLILEDDVISGVTLRLVIDALKRYDPRSLALYLGRRREDQQLERVGTEIDRVFLAEECLDTAHREQYETEFARFFSTAAG
jgi:hypothetical protein